MAEEHHWRAAAGSSPGHRRGLPPWRREAPAAVLSMPNMSIYAVTVGSVSPSALGAVLREGRAGMGDTDDVANVGRDEVERVAVDAGGHRIYLSARQDKLAPETAAEGEEEEISFRQPSRPRLEQLLDGVAGFAQEIASRLQSTDASKVSVQFGCEVLVEAGQIIAVIGKASSKSTITVGLEWTKPTP